MELAASSEDQSFEYKKLFPEWVIVWNLYSFASLRSSPMFASF